MAETLEVLEILLRGNDAQLRRILDAAQRESKQTGDSIRRNLNFADIGASLGGLAGGGGILFALKSMAQESAKTEAAWRVLRATVNTSSEFDQAKSGIAQVADTLKLTESQVVDSFTQMVRAGFGIEQVTQLLISGGASALAFGRDAVAGLEGVSSAAVTGQSIALNAIGIAENIGPALLEARKQTAGLGEAQQKAAENAAFYNVITKATAAEVGTLGVTLAGLPGSQAAVNEQFVTFRNQVGGIAAEGLIPLNNALAGTLGFINDLPEGTLRVATAMTAAGVSVVALGAGVGTLALVLGPLAGPVGVLALAAAGLAGLITVANQVPEPIRSARDAIDELTEANNKLAEAAETAAGAQRKNLQDEALVEVNNAKKALDEARANLQTTREGFGYNDPGARQSLINVLSPVAEQIQLVEQLESSLARAQGTYRALLTPLASPAAPTSNGTSNPPPINTERTIADVFGDLEQAGTVSQQFAEALGTPEAKLEDLETRAALVGDALKEAFKLNAAENQIEFLRERLVNLSAEAKALSDQLNAAPESRARSQGRPAPQAVIDAQTQAQSSRTPEAIAAAQADVDQRRVRNAQREAQASLQLANNLQSLRERTLAAGEQLGSDTKGLLGGLAATFDELIVSMGQAQARVNQAAANRPENEARGGMRQSYIDANDPLFAGEGGYRDQLQSFSGTNTELDAIRSNIQQSLQAGELTLQQYRELLAIYERLAAAGPINLVGSPNGQQGSATVAPALAILPGATDPDTGRPLEGGAVPTVELNADPFAEVSEQFLSGLQGVFADAAQQLGYALGSGEGVDGAGIFSSLLGLGSQAAFMAGGPAGIGLGLGLSLLGGLVQGVGARDENDPSSQAAKEIERRGGASTINLNAYFNQQVNLDSGPLDPKTNVALRRYIDEGFRSLIDQLDLGRRLDRGLPARG